MSSIFISHSSHDNAWAERIRDWLLDEREQRQQEQRFRSLFLDFDPDHGIQVGERWRDQLYEHLQLCAAVIVVCSEAYASSQWCLAELGVAMASGKLVLPVRIAAGTPLPKLLSETQATALTVIDLEEGAESGWQRLLKGLEPLSWQSRLPWPPQGEPGASPFPGLEHFERRHAAVFFGQDRMLRTLRETINQLPQRQSRLLLILGASGCGKSSLLRAGLLPWLAGSDKGRWIVLEPFRPEEDPAPALVAALRQAHRSLQLPPPDGDATTAEALHQQLRQLRLQSGQQDARVVIPIDQFEETLGRGDGRDPKLAAADAFLARLAALLAIKNSQVLIIATLRSDFFGQFQLHPSGLQGWAGDPIALGPMEPAGFRQVIEGPAQRVGLRLEPGLSDSLVADTETGDALPLLAFTLEELWKQHVPGVGLTLEQYRTFGRLQGAVHRKADAVLTQSLPAPSAEEIEALQQAFVEHLIRLTTDGKAVKQPTRRSLLPPASLRLLDLFVEARLLVTGKGADGDHVEIAHEALLRTWPTLVGWIDAGRENLLQRLRVRRLVDDLKQEAPERQRRQSLDQLAALAAAGGSEQRAVQKEGTATLTELLGNSRQRLPLADREDAALVLALIGAVAPLKQCLDNLDAPVSLRRRAAESLGLLARRSGDREQRKRIAGELEGWLRRETLDVKIEIEVDPATLDPAMLNKLAVQIEGRVREGMQQMILEGLLPADLGQEKLQEIYLLNVNQNVMERVKKSLWESGEARGWKEHDERLPLLQGASRGLQLAASADLPLLGTGPGRVVPMLTLTALEGIDRLRIRTELVEVPLWRLPLPDGEQLELVMVKGGDYKIGSPADEEGRSAYSQFRSRCDPREVDVEALRMVQLQTFAMVRHPITQRQWVALVKVLPEAQQSELNAATSTFRGEGLWETHGQPGCLPVDSVSWVHCNKWLHAFNGWLAEQWSDWSKQHPAMGCIPIQLALPSENQWEVACRGHADHPTPFHFGDTLDYSWARYDSRSYTYGKGRRGKYEQRPVPIGFFGLVNRNGLAELHGQLYEWCCNLWHRQPLYGAPKDGSEWESSDPELSGDKEQRYRLLRGGVWNHGPHNARSAFRNGDYPDYDANIVGLRPICLFPPGFLLDA